MVMVDKQQLTESYAKQPPWIHNYTHPKMQTLVIMLVT